MKTLPIILICLFQYTLIGQNIEGEYCSKFRKNRKIIGGGISNCLKFNNEGRFSQTITTDIGMVMKGDYQLIENKLILIYDLENDYNIKDDYELFEIEERHGLTYEEFYKKQTGIQIGEREKLLYYIKKKKTDILVIKNIENKRRIKLYRKQ
ncbi:hypothetical protein [Psychroserpens algicola]|uniref:Uncharacterized protein n=1 Tax=Psychroserpens algicola TaxID=1719034 RepID=A0ABT0HEL3_9FLAO|nr:hypothetical protein [Psychroserpens algicola]MCK8482305.1 hypothetical protein [Psychroserpens algicola]